VPILGTTLAKELETIFDSKYYRPSVWYEYGYRYMPVVRGTVGEGPMLNILGEPVRIYRHPIQRQTTLIENMLKKEDPVWVMLAEKAETGVFLPRISSIATVRGRYGDRRRMTPKEYYEDSKLVGREYRNYLEKNLDKIKQMDREETMKYFDFIGGAAKKRARSALKL
jgi:hypothetical protein